MDQARPAGRKSVDALAVERLESLGYSLSLPPPTFEVVPEPAPASTTLQFALPAASVKKEDLTLGHLRAIVESHRMHATNLANGDKRRAGEKRDQAPTSAVQSHVHTLSESEPTIHGTPNLVSSTVAIESYSTVHPEREKRQQRVDQAVVNNVNVDSTTPPPSSPSSSIESPTNRCARPCKRRKKTAVPLLALLAGAASGASASASSSASSSLVATCESLVQLAPTLSLADLVHLAQSLQENAQLLAIAQSQALATGRTFGSSFDTLARISSPPRAPTRDPSKSALVAAKALNLFALPSDEFPLPVLPVPNSPLAPPPLVLTTPRTLCRQCNSALTIRTKPSGPFLLVSPSAPPRPVLVASHVCTKCRTRHAPDHVEISHESRKVWIWEDDARYAKVGDRVWVSSEFTRHFAALLLQQRVSPGGFATVWNDLHGPEADTKAGIDVVDGQTTQDDSEDLDSESDSADTSVFKLSPAHVWRSFVIWSSIRAARRLDTPLLTIPRPSSEFLVRFANRSFFCAFDNVHVLAPHTCAVCTRNRRRKWNAGPASQNEVEKGVKWAGSLKPEVASGALREDTDLYADGKARFAICDGISIGHLLCAYPACSNPPTKSTRQHRFCKVHLKSHQRCGLVGCHRTVAQISGQRTASEACSVVEHRKLWEKFVARRDAVKTRGWRGQHSRRRDGATADRLSGGVEENNDKSEGEGEGEGDGADTDEEIGSMGKDVDNTWSLRRVAKLQLLVASCGTPLAWTKLNNGESPHAVLRFLTLVHAQLPQTPSSFPSYIAYDRACDVLREAVLSTSPSVFQNPFETPKKRRRNQPAPLPSFLLSSRLVVTGFHQQGHSTSDGLCQKFCNSAPLDGMAPDLVIPYVTASSAASSSRRQSDRVFERAFNTSAAEQLNSSLRGFTHLLQGMKADNFDFLVSCILIEKKEKLERDAGV